MRSPMHDPTPRQRKHSNSIVQSLVKALGLGIENFTPEGDIRHVYVQLQFDCGTLPNAVRNLPCRTLL